LPGGNAAKTNAEGDQQKIFFNYELLVFHTNKIFFTCLFHLAIGQTSSIIFTVLNSYKKIKKKL